MSMTTLAAYAAFLTARWDEMEAEDWHAADCEQNTYNAGPCDCGVPALTTADLAAKRAILADAVESARWATNPDCPPESASFYRDRAGHLGDALHHLATPFRDHPDHPANQEQP